MTDSAQSKMIFDIGGLDSVGYGRPIWVREGTKTQWTWRVVTYDEKQRMLAALRSSALPETGEPVAYPAECDWPNEPFGFHNDPGEHDPCYVVMPGGAMLPLNHHAGEGVDIARAKFIVEACNGSARWFDVAKTEAAGRERMAQLAASRLSTTPQQGGEPDRTAFRNFMAQLAIVDNGASCAVTIPEQTIPSSVYDKALAASFVALRPSPDGAVREALEKARDFIDPDRDPPRMTNRELVALIDSALSQPHRRTNNGIKE